jgi:hypothetical protein
MHHHPELSTDRIGTRDQRRRPPTDQPVVLEGREHRPSLRTRAALDAGPQQFRSTDGPRLDKVVERDGRLGVIGYGRPDLHREPLTKSVTSG